jgi:oxygen-independent coproporphyrinogen-3 oxidase
MHTPEVITPSAGLYVHFPYCVSICNYCDFDRQATGFSSIPRYVEAVVAEIGMQRRRPLHSIFFGGGTPSLMSGEQVRSILDAAAAQFDLLPGAEITLEANPGECTVDRLTDFRAAGVNRLSIGIQSLDDQTLQSLSRRHKADEARAEVADVMYRRGEGVFLVRRPSTQPAAPAPTPTYGSSRQ